MLCQALESVGVRVGGRKAVHVGRLEVFSTGGKGAGQSRYLLASARPTGLDAVAALDDIGLEGYGPWAAVQLQEEAAGVAQHGARLIAAPEGRGARGAVLADGLAVVVSARARLQRARMVVLSIREHDAIDKEKREGSGEGEGVGKEQLTGEFAFPPAVAGAAVA